jgi:glycosyltransferase involved in cell wall biosynthesis
MSRSDCTLSAILPAYEEAERLEGVIADLRRVLEREVARFEIIVVTSASARDGTPALARTLAARDDRVRIVEQPSDDPGYGRAVALGIAAAREDWLFLTDADGQFDFDDLPRFLAELPAVDGVVGYRERRADGASRRLAGRMYSAVVRAMLEASIRDVDCAFKLIRRERLAGVELSRRSGAINAEILLAAMGRGRWVELPVRHRARIGELSRFEAKLGPFVVPRPSEAIALSRDVGALAVRAAVARFRAVKT